MSEEYYICRIGKTPNPKDGTRWYDNVWPLYLVDVEAASITQSNIYYNGEIIDHITIWNPQNKDLQLIHGKITVLKFDEKSVYKEGTSYRLSINNLVTNCTFEEIGLYSKKKLKEDKQKFFKDLKPIDKDSNKQDSKVFTINDKAYKVKSTKRLTFDRHEQIDVHCWDVKRNRLEYVLFEEDDNSAIVDFIMKGEEIISANSQTKGAVNCQSKTQSIYAKQEANNDSGKSKPSREDIIQGLLEYSPDDAALALGEVIEKRPILVDKLSVLGIIPNQKANAPDNSVEINNLRDSLAKAEKIISDNRLLKDTNEKRENALKEAKSYENKKSDLEKDVNRLRNEQADYNAKVKAARKAHSDLIDEGEKYIKQLETRAKEPINLITSVMLHDRVTDVINRSINGEHTVSRENSESCPRYMPPREIKKSETAIELLVDDIQSCRTGYKQEQILNIITCISLGFITVFSGNPGTGKTSICTIIAKAMGLVDDGAGDNRIVNSRFIHIQVERGWTTKRDWVGYYNPLTKKFDHSNSKVFEALESLNSEAQQYKSNQFDDSNKPLPFLMLLDEANLSPMEYYWGEFIGACDKICDNQTSSINLGEDYIFELPRHLRFVATINNDHTTEALSPRLIDRAWIIKLPDNVKPSPNDKKPEDLGSRLPIAWSEIESEIIPTDEEMKSFKLSKDNEQLLSEITLWLKGDRIPTSEKIDGDIPVSAEVSPRVNNAVLKYCAAIKKVSGIFSSKMNETCALDYAIAQRLLPHISGNGSDFGTNLETMSKWCRKKNLVQCKDILDGIIMKGHTNMHYYRYFS